MKDNRVRITILGSRGSVPVDGKAFSEFGGATGCVRYVAGDHEVYIDAGSGIVGATPMEDSKLSIILTHPHLDHMIGLPFFKGLSQKDREIDIYLKKRSGLGVQDILRYLYTPPLWPLGVFDYPAKVFTPGMPESFMLGDIRVDTMEGRHPGGVTIFKLTYGDSVFVYATDFEHEDQKVEELTEFATGADLLIYDGQYTDEEYDRCKGYGHSTPNVGVGIARAAGVQELMITHHAPEHTDDELLAMEKRYQEENPDIRLSFARCGQEIELQ